MCGRTSSRDRKARGGVEMVGDRLPRVPVDGPADEVVVCVQTHPHGRSGGRDDESV